MCGGIFAFDVSRGVFVNGIRKGMRCPFMEGILLAVGKYIMGSCDSPALRDGRLAHVEEVCVYEN